MDEDVAAFRAAHASASAAIEDCDRPTWALQLAFEATSDKKAVIACGVLAAQRLTPSTTSLQLLNPFPTQLDVVERWAGKGRDRATRSMFEYKAFGIAIFVVAAIALILRALFLEAWLVASDLAKILTTIGALIAIYACAAIVKRLLEQALEQRVSRLDEEQALAIVLEQLSALSAKKPEQLPLVMRTLRSSLGLILDAKN